MDAFQCCSLYFDRLDCLEVRGLLCMPSRLAICLPENFFDGAVGEGRVARMIIWISDLMSSVGHPLMLVVVVVR